MGLCLICKKSLVKGDLLVVLSYFGDFTQNEKVYHQRCYLNNGVIQTFSETNHGEEKSISKWQPAKTGNNSGSLCYSLKEALVELGEKTSLTEVIRFVHQNSNLSTIEDLIGKWFSSRNHLGTD